MCVSHITDQTDDTQTLGVVLFVGEHVAGERPQRSQDDFPETLAVVVDGLLVHGRHVTVALHLDWRVDPVTKRRPDNQLKLREVARAELTAVQPRH